MPVNLNDKDEFVKVLDRAVECRVKLSYKYVSTESGRKKVQVLKVKARTPHNLYTIVFDDVAKGIEFAKSIKEKCKNMVVLDSEIQDKI